MKYLENEHVLYIIAVNWNKLQHKNSFYRIATHS